MILHLNDISCFIANWEDKATNIRKIADTLNIGTDALVFFDDNPFEREIVKRYLPEVKVINVPEDPALYIRALDDAHCFEWSSITEEDTLRTESYLADSRRKEMEYEVIDYDSYLENLKMEAEIGPVNAIDLARFVQLINKSNQFNLRTKRYSEAAVAQMMNDNKTYALLGVALNDIFGRYGIISCIVLQRIDYTVFIDTWVMSCRVLKRGVEVVTFQAICDCALEWGCNRVIGEFIPTKKNSMVANLLPDMGMTELTVPHLRCNSGTARSFELDLADLSEKKICHITVCRKGEFIHG